VCFTDLPGSRQPIVDHTYASVTWQRGAPARAELSTLPRYEFASNGIELVSDLPARWFGYSPVHVDGWVREINLNQPAKEVAAYFLAPGSDEMVKLNRARIRSDRSFSIDIDWTGIDGQFRFVITVVNLDHRLREHSIAITLHSKK
jgi:hypothetical protein